VHNENHSILVSVIYFSSPIKIILELKIVIAKCAPKIAGNSSEHVFCVFVFFCVCERHKNCRDNQKRAEEPKPEINKKNKKHKKKMCCGCAPFSVLLKHEGSYQYLKEREKRRGREKNRPKK